MKKSLLNLIVVVTLLFGFLLTSCQQDSHVMFQDTKGKQYVLKDYAGKWIVINYWASWCKPCITEIPELNAFSKNYKNQVLVLGVSYDQEQGKELERIVQRMQVAFPTLSFDPTEELGIDNIQTLPTTLILNPKGKLEKTLHGMQTQKSLAQAMNLTNVQVSQ